MRYLRFSSRRLRLWLAILALCAALPSAAQVPVPEMVAIPEGSFLMGSDEGATWEQPVHRVEVSAFLIAARPVTNGQFRAFRPGYENPVSNADTAPVRGVSWEDASAYCAWLQEKTGQSFRLPTEAEWERAVRGGLEQKQYPWGDDPVVPEDAVGSRSAWPPPPPNPYGIFVEHELWEWVADFYHRHYYQESPPEDPKGPPEGEFRVLRGGSYPNDPNSMRCSNRGSARPKTVLPNVTFRVASDAGLEEISQLQQPAAPAPAISSTQPAEPRTQPPARAAAAAATRAADSPARPAVAGAAASNAPVSNAPVSNSAPADSAPPAAPPRSTPQPRPAQPATPAPQQAPSQAPARSPVQSVGGGPAELTRVDVTVSSEQVILGLSLTGTVEYSTMELDSPGRIVVDVSNANVATPRKYGSIPVGDLGVEQVRWAPFEADSPTARLVVDLLAPVSYSIEAAPSGLVIQLRPR